MSPEIFKQAREICDAIEGRQERISQIEHILARASKHDGKVSIETEFETIEFYSSTSPDLFIGALVALIGALRTEIKGLEQQFNEL